MASDLEFGWPFLHRSAYGPCCNKCANRPIFKDGKAHSNNELFCTHNPSHIGTTRHHCNNFTLDTKTWFNVNYQRYEVNNYKKHYGCIPLEVYL